jgi:hypothetical protein
MRAKQAVVMGVLVAASVACSTSVGLMEPPPTSPPGTTASGPLNRAPSAKIENQGAARAGAGYQLRVEAYDPEEGTLTIQWSASEGTFSSATTTRTVWTPGPTTTSASITVTVTDSQGASATDTTKIVVR